MKKIRIFFLALLLIFCFVFIAGCWNYREIDQLAVVAGVAIDKGTKEKYKVTVEIMHVGGERETKVTPKIISMEGKTIFDAVRNEISLSGKKLYWSHTKVLIINKELAREGCVKVLSWFNRDAETRADINVLVSKEATAKEIFEGVGTTEEVKSFEIEDLLQNEKNLGKAPVTEIWKFVNDLESPGISPLLPTIDIIEMEGKKKAHVMGSAVFKGDQLLGFLDGDETKAALFVKDEVKGGILVGGEVGNGAGASVSLEIFGTKTEKKPIITDKGILMNVSIKTEVAIDEIQGTANYIEEEGRKKLEQDASKVLKTRAEGIIKKIQKEYGTDIFGFGSKLRRDHPNVWKSVDPQWESVFKNLQVDVNTKVHIRNSALMSKPLEIGD